MENHIITIVDLRSDEEAAEKPCILKEQKGFRYFHLPVTGGGDTPKSLEHLHSPVGNARVFRVDCSIELINFDSSLFAVRYL